jgi:hypothetical protein
MPERRHTQTPCPWLKPSDSMRCYSSCKITSCIIPKSWNGNTTHTIVTSQPDKKFGRTEIGRVSHGVLDTTILPLSSCTSFFAFHPSDHPISLIQYPATHASYRPPLVDTIDTTTPTRQYCRGYTQYAPNPIPNPIPPPRPWDLDPARSLGLKELLSQSIAPFLFNHVQIQSGMQQATKKLKILFLRAPPARLPWLLAIPHLPTGGGIFRAARLRQHLPTYSTLVHARMGGYYETHSLPDVFPPVGGEWSDKPIHRSHCTPPFPSLSDRSLPGTMCSTPKPKGRGDNSHILTHTIR